MSGPHYGWIGDDFTGASDTLATLAHAGVRAMLFLGVPTRARLADAECALRGPLQAVGLAAATRAMAQSAMEAALLPAGAFLAASGCRVLHYKVCSTFDSAPNIGNIAVAVRVLRRLLSHPLVAIVGGQPSLGRYCAFSHLFAQAGAGGAVERIDRHPTMRNHPSTPMQESDLRQHLALQGLEPVLAVHHPAYAAGDASLGSRVSALLAGVPAAVLFDVVDARDLAPIGRLLWREAGGGPLLAVGASSVAQALLQAWPDALAVPPLRASREKGPVFAFAGSLSPVTARQIEASPSYERVPLGLDELEAPGAALARVDALLAAGRSVLAFTPREKAERPGVAQASARFVRQVVDVQAARGRPLRRIAIAGGDTSSFVVEALQPWGLSWDSSPAPGVAVSRVHSDNVALDGVRLMLKGGQMGSEDLFERFLG